MQFVQIMLIRVFFLAGITILHSLRFRSLGFCECRKGGLLFLINFRLAIIVKVGWTDIVLPMILLMTLGGLAMAAPSAMVVVLVMTIFPAIRPRITIFALTLLLTGLDGCDAGQEVFGHLENTLGVLCAGVAAGRLFEAFYGTRRTEVVMTTKKTRKTWSRRDAHYSIIRWQSVFLLYVGNNPLCKRIVLL